MFDQSYIFNLLDEPTRRRLGELRAALPPGGSIEDRALALMASASPDDREALALLGAVDVVYVIVPANPAVTLTSV